VCAGCQVHQYVRRDGLVCKHRSRATNGRCAGSETVPIPVPTPNYNLSPEHRHDGKLLDRWDFLSMPLIVLQQVTRAHPCEIAAPDLGFRGSIRAVRGDYWVNWVLSMPIGMDPMERDLTARGLLAAAHGIDVSDWPIEMEIRPA
jgi:hypothetical protein